MGVNMTLARNGAIAETVSASDRGSDKNSANSRSGLGVNAQIAMWVIVVTLCLIAVPRGLFDTLSGGSPANKSQAQIQDQMRALEARVNLAVAAANEATSSARIAAACAASIASGSKQTRNCVTDNSGQAQIPNTAGTNQVDQLRPLADIAKMTLDATKDKFDSLKEANDKLFSVLAAMGALLAFLGFKGLDSFMTAKTKAEEAVDRANLAQKEADRAAVKLGNFLDKAYQIENRAEINVSHGIALREMAAVYKQCWDLQNPDKALPKTGSDQYRAYLTKALYYLNAALNNRNELDEILILRAMGTQCNVYRRLEDHEMALVIARQIIGTYPDKDDSAYYNAACYCSLIGSRWAKTHESAPADYSALAIDYLRQAIALDSENKKEASADTDFTLLKSVKSEEFAALVK